MQMHTKMAHMDGRWMAAVGRYYPSRTRAHNRRLVAGTSASAGSAAVAASTGVTDACDDFDDGDGMRAEAMYGPLIIVGILSGSALLYDIVRGKRAKHVRARLSKEVKSLVTMSMQPEEALQMYSQKMQTLTAGAWRRFGSRSSGDSQLSAFDLSPEDPVMQMSPEELFEHTLEGLDSAMNALHVNRCLLELAHTKTFKPELVPSYTEDDVDSRRVEGTATNEIQVSERSNGYEGQSDSIVGRSLHVL